MSCVQLQSIFVNVCCVAGYANNFVNVGTMALNRKLWDIAAFLSNHRGVFINIRDGLSWNQYAALTRSVEEKLGLPPKPKRPLTPYFRFMAQIRPVLLQKNPQAKPTEIVKMAAQQWEKIDSTTKEHLEAEYKQDMVEFLEKQVKYDQRLTEEQRQEIRKAKIEKKEEVEKQKLKKKMKELGKPKKPLTSFLLFLTDKRDTRGNTPFREWQQNIGKLWENLPEEQKKVYIQQHKKNMEVYKKELQIWEEKMIRLGHIDVVRNEALIEPKAKSHHAKYKDGSE